MSVSAEAINHQFNPVNRRQLTLVETGNNYQAGVESNTELERHRFKGQAVLEGLRAEHDAVTQFAELVDGQMRTEFELTFDGNDLYGVDGRSVNEITDTALNEAKQAAKENPNLWFEVRRRSLEREEYLLMLEMAKGNGPNTMLITSDFPEELKEAAEDIGGYNVSRQQTMARALIRKPNGNIRLVSQTLDGSNRQALEAIHEEFNNEVYKGELLGQRIHEDLTEEEQLALMDRVTGIYDRKMTDLFGGQWYAGRRPVDYRNTYDFVSQQRDLIDLCKDLMLSGKLTDRMMYDLAATMNGRFLKHKRSITNAAPVITTPAEASLALLSAAQVNYSNRGLHEEIRLAGNAARKEGRAFSACGSTLKAEGIDESTLGQLSDAGYNRFSGDRKSWHGGKRYKNSKCVSCNKVKHEVGACRICEDCVKNPKGKVRTVQGRTGDPKKAKKNKEPARVYSFEAARRAREKRKSSF